MKRLSLFLLLFSFAVTSQAQSIDDFDMSAAVTDRVTPVSPYLLTGRLKDNVFGSAALGTGFYFGDHDGKGSEGGRAGLAWEISAGKWITPFVGLRLQFSFLNARGHSYGPGAYTHGTADASGYYRKRFSIDNYRGDLLINVRNLLEGYGKNRIWDCIAVAGAGIGHSHGNSSSANEFNLNLGVLNVFPLAGRLDGTFELRYMAVKSRFDGIEGKGLDGSLCMTFGLQFNFGRKGFKRPIQLLQ